MAARAHSLSRSGAVRVLGALTVAALLPAAIPPAQARIVASCDSQAMPARAYLDCLNREQAQSERDLAGALAGAEASIKALGDLQPAQRRRWIDLLTEAQGRFVNWRNFECQSIAPYEGRDGTHSVGGRLGGSGVIGQRLICLISHNQSRAADLALRYSPPAGWTPPPEEAQTPALQPGVADRSSTPGPSVRIIDLSP
ncbi:lysozyme inhibitor LprI family protein [Ancylobacter pratisalsi]|uniref:DUF1311 domain-containing protein n=1 Tax=Ancylobacter pratisalsi TaxID=1745854 RepID=A0A6P1YJ26_9HYPH|nr:lysozyme inhibitor LprI family protein [Ancylobacter pratisalsi]QIB33309.1 DUF1311 domain-containing protein [Ancylobacter pratisalsi]